MTDTHFNRLVRMFDNTDELGHCDSEFKTITLYNIPSTSIEIQSIMHSIETITTDYKLKIHSPQHEFTNITINNIK